MASPGPPDLDPVLHGAFRDAGQEHVFAYWGELDGTARRELAAQAGSVDLPLVTRLFRASSATHSAPPVIAPFPIIGAEDPRRPDAAAAGRKLLAEGRVGFVTVAGGQATRLGLGPIKGARAVGPVSGKSLFEWHAEKILAASRRYDRRFCWAIMVSDANGPETESLFEDEGWFGLEGRVRFVRQRMMPAVDEAGRILLASPGRIAMSPNGHGGAIEALGRGGALSWFAREGAGFLSFFQVDNALINAADPAFLGWQVIRSAEMSAKVVRKRDPLEKAGIVALLDGRPGVLEYSELPDDIARARDGRGELLYGWASIAAHVFSREFLERRLGCELPWHTARKPVPALDAAGRPASVAALKFETFIFDAIPAARSFIAVETRREEEFAPLKNAEGENSPATVRAAILARTRNWYAALGRKPPDDPERLEIGPLEAYDLETFADFLAAREDRGEPA